MPKSARATFGHPRRLSAKNAVFQLLAESYFYQQWFEKLWKETHAMVEGSRIEKTTSIRGITLNAFKAPKNQMLQEWTNMNQVPFAFIESVTGLLSGTSDLENIAGLSRSFGTVSKMC